MENESPFLLTKQLETQLNAILSAIDVYVLSAGERKIILALKRELTDVRLDVRDYELSETRPEQLKYASAARKRLEQIRKHILAASEYNVFSAVDVALTSAQVEQITTQLK